MVNTIPANISMIQWWLWACCILVLAVSLRYRSAVYYLKAASIAVVICLVLPLHYRPQLVSMHLYEYKIEETYLM